MRPVLARLGLAVLVATLAAPASWAQQSAETLVVDLSSHLIAITPDFTGVDLLLFGTTDGRGDVVVVIRGPENDLVVRRKDRVAGLWVNTEAVVFKDVSGFYAVAASRPLEDLDAGAELAFNQIGVDNLRLDPVDEGNLARGPLFREALLDGLRRRNLYSSQIGDVAFIGERLFRTTIHFPANVPVGTYSAEVYLIRDGEVVTAVIPPLAVRKSGFGADVFHHAYESPASYGAVAVVFALVAGFVASAVFRKV